MPSTQFQACASATGDTAFWATAGGTITFDTATKRGTSQGSWKLNTSNPAVTASLKTRAGVVQDAGARISWWMNIPANTPAATTPIMNTQIAAGTAVVRISLNTNGTLAAEGIGATVVNGTTAITTNTWHRIAVSYTITSSTVFSIQVYLDGAATPEITITNNGTLTNTVTTTASLVLNSAAGVNFVAYVDEIYIDNGSDLADVGVSLGSATNNQLGVTRKAPTSNDVNNFDSTIGSSPINRADNVSEVPISATNGFSQAASSQVQESYNLQGRTVGDVNLTGAEILSRTAWIWAKAAAGGSGTPAIVDHGTTSPIVLTSAAALYTVTTDGPDSPTKIGMISTGTADDTFLYECGTVVSYISNAGQASVAGKIKMQTGGGLRMQTGPTLKKQP